MIGVNKPDYPGLEGTFEVYDSSFVINLSPQLLWTLSTLLAPRLVSTRGALYRIALLGDQINIPRIRFYEIEGKDSGDLFLKWMLLMNNQTSVPSVCSVSYVEGEDELTPGYVTKTNVEFIKA